MLIISLAPSAYSQGSIFGAVVNSDASTPVSGEISFYGYLDDTDEEIRIESSVGSGYDNGNWYDDFQNYLTEVPGNPYDYHFFNAANGEGAVLSKLIPNNSFQQEDISLAAVTWPEEPAGLEIQVVSASKVEIQWTESPSLTYHVYRREGASNGSFFRIDDSTGSLANPGIADNAYVDSTVDSGATYDYLLVAEDPTGQLGPHSQIATVTVALESFIRGDSNGDGLINVGDCVFTIDYIFRFGPAPVPYEAADADCDGMVNVGDVVYTIQYIFYHGPAPGCP